MATSHLLRFGAVLTIAASGSGCALFHTPANAPEIRSASTKPTLSPADADYAAAVGQIERRDYATALELLQSARARNPQDARVLNAFGVVYDKLGRFDLSARYYAQAEAAAPGSPVVRANLAYSQELQQHRGDPTAVALATPAARSVSTLGASDGAAAAPAARPAVAAAAPPAPRIGPTRLEIVNATGAPGATEPVRAWLAHRGWSASKARMWNANARARTTIYFPPEQEPVARALSRTMPQGALLATCQTPCRSLRLIVGEDVNRPAWAANLAGRPAPKG